MKSNAFYTIPIPVPVETGTTPAPSGATDELAPRDNVEKEVLAEIEARNQARRQALLPLLDVLTELRHFRDNRADIEYGRFLRANLDLFNRLEKKFYRRWVAKHPTKKDFYVPAQLEAHKVIGWLMKRQRRAQFRHRGP